MAQTLKGVGRVPGSVDPRIRRVIDQLVRSAQWLGGTSGGAIQLVDGVISLVIPAGQPLDQDPSGLVVVLDGGTLTQSASGLKVSADGVGQDELGILTTAGDLLGFSTEPDRIPVGTDGQLLTVDSGEAFGVAWADPTPGLLDRSTTEQVSGFLDRNAATVYEKTVAFGALPNTTTATAAHGITDLDVTELIEILAWASDGSRVINLPFYDGTGLITIEVDATNVSITTDFDATGFTACDVFLRYTKAASSGFDSGFDSGFGA